MVRSITLSLLLFLAVLFPGVAQSSLTGGDESPEAEVAGVPRGFGDLALGQSLEEVKELLLEDPNFDFRGDPDVSMLMRPNESLIDCRGFSYIDRAYFQFYEKSLYTITLVMNEDLIDHYTLYTDFVEKYGNPDRLSPTGAEWESEEYLFSLERPLSVKYVDRRVFETLRRRGRMDDSAEELSRERFLELF